ncbi:MAG: phosphate transport system regulatory protein PhoU [Haloquadratum walsbyi J07HQW2]|jgi:phosphate uptake regulator, PhoU|uniref:Phosphate transport system regulatory protein PhoU n=1 Tax=Haloquadratum walsbyi J07HQW2 TaxID=1238425 RepID=U1NFE1_9EURY|nr:MAG: phosphate transport system regulatory protein PhoU [Haloquadratum walsbyi J07HQW2]
MPRESYQKLISQLREDVLYMSELVSNHLRSGLDALEQKDEELAMEIIERDEDVNTMYLEIEQQCIKLIALQQPVASDLRIIAASFKIITDLERIGDLATNLAEYASVADRDVFPEVDIQHIGDEIDKMLTQAMQAYADEDAERCRAVAASNNNVDELCEAASSHTAEYRR